MKQKQVRFRRSAKLARLVALATLIVIAVPGIAACRGEPDSLTIGMESTAVNSLIYLAQDQGYFEQNRLNVTIKDYPSGKAAVDGLLREEVDLATASEFVVAGLAISGSGISTIGSIDEFLHVYLVARKDRGVEQPSDLVGKKIGVPLKTLGEFSLARYLALKGVNVESVTLVDTAANESADSLVGGRVDAVITWRPFVNAIEDQLGSKVVKWQAQSQQTAYCVVVAGNEWLSGHPDLVKRLLQSLLAAQVYQARHPKDAEADIQAKLGYDKQYMATVWPEHRLVVALDQSMIAAMQDEARWIVSSGSSRGREVPDFRRFIHDAALRAILPDAVDVIP